MQVDLQRWASGVPRVDLAFLSDDDERVNLEYAGRNSQDAMRIIKGDNSASYRKPCKAPNDRVSSAETLNYSVFPPFPGVSYFQKQLKPQLGRPKVARALS